MQRLTHVRTLTGMVTCLVLLGISLATAGAQAPLRRRPVATGQEITRLDQVIAYETTTAPHGRQAEDGALLSLQDWCETPDRGFHGWQCPSHRTRYEADGFWHHHTAAAKTGY